MKRSRNSSILAWSLGFGLMACAASAAVHREAALGAEGELYQVRAGSYGSLFPNGTGARTFPTASTPVLALEISRPGAAVQRLLVPGTDNPDVESSPSLVVEESSQAIFLVWEIRINSIHSILKVSSFDGEHWSEPIEVSRNPSSLKTAPQLAITRDAYSTVSPQGEPVARQRTILHLIWAEEQGGNDVYKARYTPLVVEKGLQLGRSPVYDLNVYQNTGAFEVVAAGAPSGLIRTPVIQSGRDGRTVVVAFADAETHRLTTVEIDSLPAELSRLADGARAQIVDLGARHSYPANRAAMAAQVRTGIVQIGGAFHPEVVQSIAERIHDLVVDSAAKGRNLVSLAEEARAQIVDLGAKLSGRGLRHQQNSSTSAIVSEIVESTFEPEANPEAGTEESRASHLIQFRLASSRPLPQLGAGDIRVFVSENGEQLILAWVQGDRVKYRSSQGEGWTDIRELVLSENLTQQKAFDILEQRVRGH